MQAGIIGTGYAARARARALQADGRAELAWVVGRTATTVTAFAEEFGVQGRLDIPEALRDPAVALVFICTANHTHSAWVEAGLLAGKHVVVEYPLALEYKTGVALAELAARQGRLLHVEHIELLSPIHQNLRAGLAQVGEPLYVRYSTQTATRPAPQRWSYHPLQFGFPLVGAVSRLQRLIDLVGPVAQVSCESRYLMRGEYFHTCYCAALLQFQGGAVGEVVFAKGEGIWQSELFLSVQGTLGGVVLAGNTITVTTAAGEQTLAAGERQGLFLRDTQAVLDYLLGGVPLYMSLAADLRGLRVASACAESAASGKSVAIHGS
ncbi:Gfo/Idh/MocA family protein [Candidatus Cyanaurora vandensis]|uniref:Gfo/Idh/MocA family protein n=1 Tax=Candidatus Cyanaurora vandensis TaxID=2714958 RepID=UPI00257ABE7D|nr:Gfo/Idh/MocA family oxidoreductase [Candidatus Cyanaurora vandensis]